MAFIRWPPRRNTVPVSKAGVARRCRATLVGIGSDITQCTDRSFLTAGYFPYVLCMNRKPIKSNTRSTCPGLVKVSALAVYFNCCRDTAEKILAQNGIQPAHHSPNSYRWTDIWAFLGRGYVLMENWAAMKEPLLKVADLVDDQERGRSERSIRRKAKDGKLPTVNIGIEDYRFRRSEIKHFFPDLAD